MTRPIIFSGPMVRAILDGRKIQTRRVVTLRPRDGKCASDCAGPEPERAWPDNSFGSGVLKVPCRDGAAQRVYCPIGESGDRLWVRETWRSSIDEKGKSVVVFAAGGARHVLADCEGEGDPIALGGDATPWNIDGPRQAWRPSIFMPRWASRITLEVASVRVERLQQISEDDAIAEGARRFDHVKVGPTFPNQRNPSRWSMEEPPNTDHCLGSARFAFANYWNSINAKRGFGWDTNPWVWVIAFRRADDPR